MLQFLKIVLLLSSIIIIASCKINAYGHKTCEKITETKNLFVPVNPKNTTLKYNTSIDVLKNHLTGILLVKRTDSITKHLVFVTELGMKMFDFEIKNNNITTSYIFEPLNKPQFIKVLKFNLNNMLHLTDLGTDICKFNNKSFTVFTNTKNNIKYFYTVSKTDELYKLETFKNKKRNSVINYTYDSNTKSYTNIYCKQFGFVKFRFNLSEIPQNQP